MVFRQKPDQIHQRLIWKHRVNISLDTVRRMCDDILKLKALKIDEKTVEALKQQGSMLLAFDGQDPGGDAPSIWCFVDLISNRILATRKFSSLDHEKLHDTLEEILDVYGVEVLGWVSDKQNVITKCHDTYYKDIPHQYCQYHFLRNTWNHLASLDSIVYLSLKKTVNSLYIHKASKNSKVKFENVGKVSVSEAFSHTDAELQAMIKVKNNVFDELRGVQLYELLSTYKNKLGHALESLEASFRFTKILQGTFDALDAALRETSSTYRDACSLFNYFQKIRKTLGAKHSNKRKKIETLTTIYASLLKQAKQRDPHLVLEECKSFLPSKQRTTVEIMTEWCRLWHSYSPGLFTYYHFPKPIRTNMELERMFSKEKQAIFNRVAKANVCRVVATRGEDYLRILHCSAQELQEDIISQYSDEVVRQLRAE